MVSDVYRGRRTADATNAAIRRESVLTGKWRLIELLATRGDDRHLAQSLFISEATVKTLLAHIYQKLGVTNRTAAINTAREQ